MPILKVTASERRGESYERQFWLASLFEILVFAQAI
jgi:hypothetical protein